MGKRQKGDRMNFEEYSKQAYSTAQYPNIGSNLVY